MNVIIDGDAASFDVPDGATFAKLMEVAYRKAADAGRVVSRVEVDGGELTIESEREMAPALLSGLSEVRLTTSSRADVLRKGLAGARVLGEAIRRDVEQAVDLLRSGDGARGMACSETCIRSLETFLPLVDSLLDGMRSGFFPAPGGSGRLPCPPSREPTGMLARLRDRHRAQDLAATAEILEHETEPDLRAWLAFLGKE